MRKTPPNRRPQPSQPVPPPWWHDLWPLIVMGVGACIVLGLALRACAVART